MTDEEQESIEDSLRKMVDKLLHDRLSEARNSYENIINRLWAGNAGGAITTLTALQHPEHPFYLLSISMFTLGLLVLSWGAYIDIRFRNNELRHIEGVQGVGGTILNVKMQYFSRPSDISRLSWVDYVAVTAFFLGLSSGLIILFLQQLALCSHTS